MYLTTLICCVIITQHIRNSSTTYQYTTEHMKWYYTTYEIILYSYNIYRSLTQHISSTCKKSNNFTQHHQEITHVILCRLILNDIMIHIKFLNDIIMFSKIVWHPYVTNFKNYVVLFLIRHNNELLMLFICHRIFEQHNNITLCDYIISLNKFNNITHSMIFSL